MNHDRLVVKRETLVKSKDGTVLISVYSLSAYIRMYTIDGLHWNKTTFFYVEL